MDNIKIEVDNCEAEKQIKRATNFTAKETELLIKLVDQKKDIIECKKTDRTTGEEKIRCWKTISDTFNSQSESYRSYKTLQIKYNNLKKNAKKNFALDKQETYKTGGGPKPPSNISSMDHEIIKIIQVEQVQGLESVYDDDQIATEVFDVHSGEEDNTEEKSGNPPMKLKWEKYNPNMLKAPKHPSLSSGNKRATKDVWAEVAQMKIKKIKLEMKLLEEESKLRKTKLNLEIEELNQKLGKQEKQKHYPKEF